MLWCEYSTANWFQAGGGFVLGFMFARAIRGRIKWPWRWTPKRWR